MEICTITGCNRSVSKPGYKLCYEHWKTDNSKSSIVPVNVSQPIILTATKPVIESSPTASNTSLLLSATKISEQLGLSRNKVNPLLAELGLIDKVPIKSMHSI